MGGIARLAVGAALVTSLAAAGPGPAEWASRSIYQVVTDRFARADSSTEECKDLDRHCGGTWAGLMENLDYIQDMGFTAVQISPVVENIPNNTEYGEGYHGYWVNNLYSINEKFGTADDLKALADELHDRDMYLMVDVVINNMAQAIDGRMPADIDFSQLQPFNDEKFYHEYCNLTDYGDDEMAQDCYLASEHVALPDLDTESDEVVEMIGEWISELVSNYSIDGLRIDAAKHVNDEFLASFRKSAGIFALGEVFTNDTEGVCRYQEDDLLAGISNFPVHFPLIEAFTAGKMEVLAEKITEVEEGCSDPYALATFAENHDIPRFAELVDDMALAKNALAFTILADGIPLVYQGQEQHMAGNYSPFNRAPLWSASESDRAYNTEAPLYNLTKTLNRLRNHAIHTASNYVTEHSTQLYVDPSTMATRKGPDGVQIVAVFSNQGEEGGEYELNVGPKAFKEGTEVVEVFDCTVSNANEAGNVTAQMDAGQPKVFFSTARMEGSGLCGYSLDKSVASQSSNDEDDKDSAAPLTMERRTLWLPLTLALSACLL